MHNLTISQLKAVVSLSDKTICLSVVNNIKRHWNIAQLVRAFAWYAKGYEFESHCSNKKYGAVAEWCRKTRGTDLQNLSHWFEPSQHLKRILRIVGWLFWICNPGTPVRVWQDAQNTMPCSSMGERFLDMEKVVGSLPTKATKEWMVFKSVTSWNGIHICLKNKLLKVQVLQ